MGKKGVLVFGTSFLSFSACGCARDTLPTQNVGI